MNMEWDSKVGPATIVGIIGSLGILVSLGVGWGSLKAELQTAKAIAEESKAISTTNVNHGLRRDGRISEQSERIGKIETSIQFIVPALQRIESKLDTKLP